jgi:thiosulfate reductase cytochrome b subunit
MSGLQIFNAYPNLHWGDKAEPEEAFFSIYAAQEDGDVKGYTKLMGLHVETTGFLGIQNTPTGPSPRAFPSWLTVPGFYWLAGARRWHFFFAWLFVLNGLLYVIFNLLNGHMRKFFLTPKDAARAPAMTAYYLRLRRESPQEEEYNPLQKMAYSGVFFILTPLILITGLAMSPQMNVAFNWLPAMFGGRQSARSFHFILTFLFVGFTFGHVFMVITTGLVNNMRSMVTGWYREKLPAPLVAPLAAPEPEPAEPARAGSAIEEAPLAEPANPNDAGGEREEKEKEDAKE